MTDRKRKQELELAFTKRYTMSDSDFKRLIQEKMERAKLYAKIQERKSSKEYA
jgi:hypothetical protein